MPHWVSYRQVELAERWDAIVIGSGMGGLAVAAILASVADKRVLVLERHYTAGGLTQVFRRPGFEWDVGVHYVGGMAHGMPFRNAFDRLSEGRLDWAPLPEAYDRVFVGGETFDFRAPRSAFRDDLVDRFAKEKGGIDLYLAEVARVVRWNTPYLAERALPRGLAAIIGPVLRRPFTRYARPTTAQVIAGFTADPMLTAVLTAQWGDYGLPPHLGSFAIHALVVDHYLDGASYPVGGAAQLVGSIAPTIAAHGGQIVVRAEVAEITIDSRGRADGVRLTDGRELRSDIVVSDAGAALTLGPLLPSVGHKTRAWRADAAEIGPSTGYVCLYLGLDRTDAELGLGGTNLWVYPDADIERRWDGMMLRGERQPVGAYISFPSAKDPSYQSRRPGRATIEAITFIPFEWFRPWMTTEWHKRGAEYEAVKAELQDWLLAQVESHVPSIRGHVVHAELSTPLSNRHFTAAPEGEAYGLAHSPRRFLTHSFGPATPIPRLYLTGQDVFACGLAGSAMGGVLAASVILRRNLVGKMMSPVNA